MLQAPLLRLPFRLSHSEAFVSRLCGRRTAPWAASRGFSSFSTAKRNDGREEVVLYERSKDYALLRSGVGFSSFHTLYWLWYVNDFIPMVNASPMEQLHVDPGLGYIGLAFALSIQSVFFVYPYRLVSKLSYDPQSNNLLLYNHRLPFIIPSETPKEMPPGTLSLNLKSAEAKRVLELNSIEQFRGHLAISKTWPPYMLDIRTDENVVEPDLLFQLLLNPKRTPSSARNDSDAASRLSFKAGKSSRRESKLRKITRRRHR